MQYNIANPPCFDVSRNAHAWRSAMTLHHPIVTFIDVDQPAGGTRAETHHLLLSPYMTVGETIADPAPLVVK
jgi:hypothetical protein